MFFTKAVLSDGELAYEELFVQHMGCLRYPSEVHTFSLP